MSNDSQQTNRPDKASQETDEPQPPAEEGLVDPRDLVESGGTTPEVIQPKSPSDPTPDHSSDSDS